MYLINKTENRISKIEEKSFSELGFRERSNLQEWLANNPEALGEDILIIQKEFNGFSDTNERLDLLGLDKQGNLIVIENKLDDSGKDVTWQSLKYASYCSTLTKEQIIRIYQDYLNKHKPNENAEENLLHFFDSTDISEISINSGSKQRIILVAGNFRKEVTSTVLWLMNYNLRIQCFKVKPLQLDELLFLEITQIIPVKEAEEYQIKIAEKAQVEIIQQDSSRAIDVLYVNFWKQLLIEMNSKSQLFRNVSPSKRSYIGINSIISGIGFYFTISKTKKFARIELYIRTNERTNDLAFNELFFYKSEIENAFGENLIWENLKKDSRIKYEKDSVDIENVENWNSIIAFMTDSMIRFYDSFQPALEKVKKAMKS
jgi:hypothetical protein